MRINDVTRHKGTDVVTITPDASVGDLLDLLFRNGIGAVVVSQDGRAVEGIVSERDVVRHLQARGAAVIDAPVADIMTTEVSTCAPTDDVEQLMRQMTELRVRHVPVVENGVLHGIVSIGDLVKHRIDELQLERDELVGYLNS
ncbi:MAG: CBS domain-containing protein [Rhodoferax sp.]|nr:CBS domain-containing protein [Actinomycetota bacterium]